jgi:hypothetical protein
VSWNAIVGGQVRPGRVRETAETGGVSWSDRIPDPEAVAAAASRGVRRELAIHKALGVPAVTWRDGCVVIVPPEELPALGDVEGGKS